MWPFKTRSIEYACPFDIEKNMLEFVHWHSTHGNQNYIKLYRKLKQPVTAGNVATPLPAMQPPADISIPAARPQETHLPEAMQQSPTEDINCNDIIQQITDVEEKPRQEYKYLGNGYISQTTVKPKENNSKGELISQTQVKKQAGYFYYCKTDSDGNLGLYRSSAGRGKKDEAK